ncbi:hypothetical protein OEZ86_005200 [Tetradesmus obliquus]|nr:hypothetical protein OEZ86_005200 [Tetradesmus obliquus]
MGDVYVPLSNHEGKVPGWKLRTSFAAPLAAAAALLLVGFSFAITYAPTKASDDHVNQYYMWFIHVMVMIFVGFGFLMTFLKRYSYSAVALNFLLSALAMTVYLLVGGAIQQFLWPEDGRPPKSGKIELDLPLLIDAAFCAGAAMISFGAVLGKASPGQLLWMVLLEVPIYALNQKLVFDVFKALDIGGSMSIHAFGAYFGLAVAMFVASEGSGSSHAKNGASYNSDITAMIGTIFLFIFWPSFNGALASNPDVTTEAPAQTQFFCVVNTVLSLLGACLSAFACSAAFEGKLDMVHIQNATLAGGVAVGSAANLKIAPGGALVIGLLAGAISTCGYVKLSPKLESCIGLRDTCGVHNLHGLPGVFGGLAAALASVLAAAANKSVLLDHGSRTYLYQLAALGCSLGMALMGGAATGLIITKLDPAAQVLPAGKMFEDSVFWAECEEEEEAEHSTQL